MKTIKLTFFMLVSVMLFTSHSEVVLNSDSETLQHIESVKVNYTNGVIDEVASEPTMYNE